MVVYVGIAESNKIQCTAFNERHGPEVTIKVLQYISLQELVVLVAMKDNRFKS